MKIDVGMSKPKKHVDKVGIVITQEVNVGPKIKQTTSIYPSTQVQLFVFCFIAVYVGTYVGLYGSGLFNLGLFNFGSYINLLCYYYLDLVHMLLGF